MALIYEEGMRSHAYDRIKNGNQRSSTGIEYPSNTNSRGDGGRERHSGGDSVGGLPSRGGCHMGPLHKRTPMGGVETRNKRHNINQAHGRSRHAEGDSVPEYKIGGKLKGRGIGHAFGHAGRNMHRALRGDVDKVGKENHAEGDSVNAYKFGAGIKKDFKDLGRGIKKGWKKEIGDPFKKKVTDPARSGAQKARHDVRKAANATAHVARTAAAKTKKVAQAGYRAAKHEYNQAES